MNTDFSDGYQLQSSEQDDMGEYRLTRFDSIEMDGDLDLRGYEQFYSHEFDSDSNIAGSSYLGKRGPNLDIFQMSEVSQTIEGPSCRDSQFALESIFQTDSLATETDSVDHWQEFETLHSQSTETNESAQVVGCTKLAKSLTLRTPLTVCKSAEKVHQKSLSKFVDEELQKIGPKGATILHLRQIVNQRYGLISAEMVCYYSHRINKVLSNYLRVNCAKEFNRVQKFKDQKGVQRYRLSIYNQRQIELETLHADVENKMNLVNERSHDLSMLNHMHQVLQATVSKNKQESKIVPGRYMPEQEHEQDSCDTDFGQSSSPKVGVSAILIPCPNPNSIRIMGDSVNRTITAWMGKDNQASTVLQRLMQLNTAGSCLQDQILPSW
jgi:hypothetical protein